MRIKRNANKNRYGRFYLQKSTYEFLKSNNGYYLFMVEHLGFIVSTKLISIHDIEFSRSITWNEILPEPKCNIERLEALKWQTQL